MRGGNMKNMMKQMKKMQKEMENAQTQLDETIFTGVANDDLVTISLSGNREVKEVKIEEEVIEMGDHELIEDLVLIALKDVLKQIEDENEKTMGKYTNDLNIPGF